MPQIAASDLGLHCLLMFPKYLDAFMCMKDTGWVANSVDPDQMPQSAASDLGIHHLLMWVYLNTCCIYGSVLGLMLLIGFKLYGLYKPTFIYNLIEYFESVYW